MAGLAGAVRRITPGRRGMLFAGLLVRLVAWGHRLVERTVPAAALPGFRAKIASSCQNLRSGHRL
ncbi:hypothetical protein GCM10009679_57860 [Saccharothrix algeriensis]|uniref:Uncharacterized protein n=1 Tax=Catellatospora bangladeshensis TaxID=310355 RepID=A0A8J3JRV8_9ACTN|nr:hypothetical protein Cba03nite_68720 [Catellatospora bangladeshensis]